MQPPVDPPRVVHEGRFLATVHHGPWEYVYRVRARGAVAMVAVTDGGALVLVEQYRIPLGCRTIELPAGIVGDADAAPDEPPLEAARRELLEETGFDAEDVFALCEGPTAAGLTAERQTFVGFGPLTRRHAGGGVEGEGITVHLVALAGLDAWLAARRRDGLTIDPRIYTGMYFVRDGRVVRPT